MTGVLRFAARRLMDAALAAAVLAFLLAVVGPRMFGYQARIMLTGSMCPVACPGDVLVNVPEHVSRIRVGQVLTYHAPVIGEPLVSHRVIAVDRTPDGYTIVQTQGDANPAPDPWQTQVTGSTVYRLSVVLPWLGKPVNGLRSPLGHLVAYLGIVALVAYGVVRIWRRRTGSPQPSGSAQPAGSAQPQAVG